MVIALTTVWLFEPSGTKSPGARSHSRSGVVDRDVLPVDSPGHEPAPRPNGERQAGHSSRDESNRLSAKQLSAIFGIAKSKGWSNKAVRDFTQEMFGKMPDFLTRKEASAAIDHLNGGHERA